MWETLIDQAGDLVYRLQQQQATEIANAVWSAVKT